MPPELRAAAIPAFAPAAAGPTVTVLGSGKGGVGRSVLAVLIAAARAELGGRHLLLDGTQNLGNLHVLLGVHPTARLESLLRNECEPGELVARIHERLDLLPSDSGSPGLYALSQLDRARLHHKLSTVFDDYDDVVVDAGHGLEGAIRAAAMRASRLVVVTVPEPAALTDAYALIKIATLQLPSLPIDVLVNRVRDEAEGVLAWERLDTAAERFLSRSVGYAGAVPDDPSVRELLQDPARLLLAPPHGPAVQAVRRLVRAGLAAAPVSTAEVPS